MGKIYKQINKSVSHEHNYIRLQVTFTSRVIAGWLITLLGLYKLWETNDPASWWPILMGGTGIMIVSRGVDHYMNNQREEREEKMQLQKDLASGAFQHSTLDENAEFNNLEENYAVKKHRTFRENMPV